MTLIEFYDKNAADNILSSLVLRPKRVVILGTDYDELSAFKERMAKIFDIQKIETKIHIFEIEDGTYPEMKKMLSEIVEKYGDCAFDISGGDSLIHTAIGAVSEKFPISIHTSDHKKAAVNIVSDAGGSYKKVFTPKLSVKECIILNGGNYEKKSSKELFKDADFVKEIKALWNICNKNCAEWNKTIGNLGAFLRYYSKSPRKGVYSAKTADIEKGFLALNKKFYLNSNIMQKLSEEGYITIHKNDAETISVSFKNDFIKEVLSKAGRLLELYTFMIGATIESRGVKFFDDYDSGVVIGWEMDKDNTSSDNKTRALVNEDVTNEVDVIFTKNVTPVFVSCKNGFVDSDELYKLSVVARRFGGIHAKKILVATYFEPDASFLRRAEELQISVLFNVDKMSFRKLSDKLCEAVVGKKRN